LRVLHVIKATGIAGAENHLIELLAGLRARDVDARLLLLAAPDGSGAGFAEALSLRGIPVSQVTIRRHFDPLMIFKLRRALRAVQPDVVHTHLFHADTYGIPAAKLAGVPLVFSSRHDDDPRRRHPVLRAVNALLWRMATGGVAISEAVKRFTIQIEGAPARKIQRIYYGVPLPVPIYDRKRARQVMRDLVGAPQEAPLLAMVCRLMDAKGIPDALAAFAQVAPEFPDAHFVIAGDGPLRSTLEKYAQALGIDGRVHFLGWQDDPYKVMASIDVLLVPSVREGFGLSILEAMSQSVPVIGSTASAIPEVIVHGETGLTVPPRSPDALADALRILMADKALRMHMGLMGLDRLETHFSAARMVDETLALYQRRGRNP
jgi:glycosyltransferase involved in cell wall biosynthesis